MSRLNLWLSQTINMALFKGDPDESLSARAWRQREAGWADMLRRIDNYFGLGHCKRVYDAQQERHKDRNA